MFQTENLIKEINILENLWPKLKRHGGILPDICVQNYFKIAYLIHKIFPKTLNTISLKDGKLFDFSEFYYEKKWIDQIKTLNTLLFDLKDICCENQLLEPHIHTQHLRLFTKLIQDINRDIKTVLFLENQQENSITCKTLKEKMHLFDAFKKEPLSDVLVDLEQALRLEMPLTKQPQGDVYPVLKLNTQSSTRNIGKKPKKGKKTDQRAA